MSSILNNLAALGASRQLGVTGINLNQTIRRLTTGKRINQASDDAAGLAISNKLGADIKIAAQAQRNANDGVSYLQVADGALDEVTTLLTRASQLAQQARTGTISTSNRANLDAEFQNILKTVLNIGQNTKFNGQLIFSTTGGAGNLSVKAGDYGAITSSLGSISDTATRALGMDTVGGNPTTTTTTTTQSTATSASALRAVIGAASHQAYFTAWEAANAIPGSDPNAAAAATNQMAAVNHMIAGNTAQARTDAAAALAAIMAYNAAHPNDPNGIATQAAIQYDVTNAPSYYTGGGANAAAVAAAATSATYQLTTTTTTPGAGVALTSTDGAATAATLLAAALASVSTMRASIGANEAQLSATSDILGIQVQNFTAAQSQIEDANIADEVVSLTKFQILNQSGTNALAKANQASQQILALLQ